MSDRKVITYKDLLAIFDELLADKPDGYGYGDVFEEIKGFAWTGGGCQNWTAAPEDWATFEGDPSDYDGVRIPMCMIGQVLNKLDVLKFVGRYDTWMGAVAALAKRNIFFTDEAMTVMLVAQQMQDIGASWDHSVLAARLALRAHRSVKVARSDAEYPEVFTDADVASPGDIEN